MKHSMDGLSHFLGTSQEKDMAQNYNEKERIVERMVQEERMSRFTCDLGSSVAVRVDMKQNGLIIFIPFDFPGVGFQIHSFSA